MSTLLPNTKKKLKVYRKRKNQESKVDHGLIKELAIREAFGSLSLGDDRQRARMMGFNSIFEWVTAGRP